MDGPTDGKADGQMDDRHDIIRPVFDGRIKILNNSTTKTDLSHRHESKWSLASIFSYFLDYFDFLLVLAASVISLLMPVSVPFLETQGLWWIGGGGVGDGGAVPANLYVGVSHLMSAAAVSPGRCQ